MQYLLELRESEVEVIVSDQNEASPGGSVEGRPPWFSR